MSINRFYYYFSCMVRPTSKSAAIEKQVCYSQEEEAPHTTGEPHGEALGRSGGRAR